MNLKLPVFFLVTLCILFYLDVFWKQRHLKIRLMLFGHELDTSLGALGLMIFLDGAILAFVLLWLLGVLTF
jgi:hypothetical protein